MLLHDEYLSQKLWLFKSEFHIEGNAIVKLSQNHEKLELDTHTAAAGTNYDMKAARTTKVQIYKYMKGKQSKKTV